LNRRLDDLNNAVAIYGPDFRTFEDVQSWARGKMSEAAAFNGDGQDGRAMWHRKTARGWQPDWSNVRSSRSSAAGPSTIRVCNSGQADRAKWPPTIRLTGRWPLGAERTSRP
jgi:hypothetical protein